MYADSRGATLVWTDFGRHAFTAWSLGTDLTAQTEPRFLAELYFFPTYDLEMTDAGLVLSWRTRLTEGAVPLCRASELGRPAPPANSYHGAGITISR